MRIVRGVAMEIAVLIEPNASGGFQASCGEPLCSTAEGPTRDAALEGLRRQLEARVSAGAELVTLSLGRRNASKAIWPDDEITRMWLEGIREAREASRLKPDPWDADPS